ncbi:MAG: dTDP-4-dehydrorhamnose 3,5-epimerase family protein [Campylobacterota bacterium]
MGPLVKLLDTPIDGLKILEPRLFEDVRGRFVKTFSDSFFRENGLNIEIRESYYSVSHRNVIRGMHFQTPPHDHIKLVYVPRGRITDVVLDIRKNSPTYGEYYALELSGENGRVLVIPKGLAHGFKSLQDDTNVTYLQTSVYAPDHDAGIHYASFGFDWECPDPRLSQRDLSFPRLDHFETPFTYGEEV